MALGIDIARDPLLVFSRYLMIMMILTTMMLRMIKMEPIDNAKTVFVIFSSIPKTSWVVFSTWIWPWCDRYLPFAISAKAGPLVNHLSLWWEDAEISKIAKSAEYCIFHNRSLLPSYRWFICRTITFKVLFEAALDFLPRTVIFNQELFLGKENKSLGEF